MTTTVRNQKVASTPGGGAAWRDPYPMYAELREHDPVHHVVPDDAPDKDYWVLSRHADVLAAARDAGTFSSAQGLAVDYGEMEAPISADQGSCRHALVVSVYPANGQARWKYERTRQNWRCRALD